MKRHSEVHVIESIDGVSAKLTLRGAGRKSNLLNELSLHSVHIFTHPKLQTKSNAAACHVLLSLGIRGFL